MGLRVKPEDDEKVKPEDDALSLLQNLIWIEIR